MMQITYTLDGIERFVDRIAGGAKHDLGERNRMMAAENPTLAHITYGGETFGQLWIETGGLKMKCHASGATSVLLQLTRAREDLADGAEAYETHSVGRGYGVSLLFERTDEQLVIKRTFEDPNLTGPAKFETTLEEFNQAMDAFTVWYHTVYLAEASWLLCVEDIQQLRRDLGYPPDQLCPLTG